jgi:hypothetical protein
LVDEIKIEDEKLVRRAIRREREKATENIEIESSTIRLIESNKELRLSK